MARSLSVGGLTRPMDLTKVLSSYFDNTSRPTVFLDIDGAPIWANPAAYRTPLMVRERARPCWSEDLTESLVQHLAAMVQQVMRTGELTGGHLEITNGREIEYEMLPITMDGLVELIAISFEDVTERHMGHELSDHLNGIYQDIISPRPIDEVVQSIIERGMRALHAGAAGVGIREDGRWVLRYTTARLDELRGSIWTEEEAVRAFTSLSTLTPFVEDDARGNHNFDQKVVCRMGIISLLSVPLVIEGRPMGVLVFNYFQEGVLIHPMQIDFARKLGIALSMALEKEKMADVEEEEIALLRDVIETSPAAIAVLKLPEREVELANRVFTDHMIERTGTAGMPSSAHKILDMMIERPWATGLPQTSVEFPVQMNGQTAYWSCSFVPMAKKRKLLLVSSNVTKQVEGELRYQEMAERKEERLRLRTILDTLPVDLIVVDVQGHVVKSNRPRQAILGNSETGAGTEQYGRFEGPWSDTGLSLKHQVWPIRRALEQGETTTGAMVDLRRSDGSMGTVIISTAPVKDKGDRIIGAVSALHDITDQQRLVHEALEAKQKVELYLDIMAHDINNLNAAAKGYLELHMAREYLTETGRKQLENSDRMLSNISELIENIRKLQEIESMGKVHTIVDLGPLLDDVAETARHTPGRKVQVNYVPKLKTMVMADELIKDLFDNLLINAIKHSPGSVEIDLNIGRTFLDGREYYRVDVEDDGPGIPDELKSRLFNRFVRGSSKTGGRGLGLYLVKRITEEYGGKVWVENRVPDDHTKGSRFVVCLPFASISPNMIPSKLTSPSSDQPHRTS